MFLAQGILRNSASEVFEDAALRNSRITVSEDLHGQRYATDSYWERDFWRIGCAETTLPEFLKISYSETPVVEFLRIPMCSDTPPTLIGARFLMHRVRRNSTTGVSVDSVLTYSSSGVSEDPRGKRYATDPHWE